MEMNIRKALEDVIQVSRNVSRFIEYGQLYVMMQCTECCDPMGSDCRDSLIVGVRGSLEINSVIEEENAALLSFDHFEASLMDEDNL